jgi:hypothetical protein
MKKNFKVWQIFALMVAIPIGLLSEVKGDVLWNNGSMVTHAGLGAGGTDVSMASLVPNTAGSNVTGALWRADNFSVGGPGWLVDSIQAFAYDTNNANPRFGEAIIRIHANDGGAPGSILTSSNATWELAGINRIFNGVGNLGNTARQVQRITANFGGFALAPGDYFFSFSVSSSADPPGNNWVPFVMDINQDDPNNPITRVGNSFVSTNSGATWVPGNVTTGDWNQAPEIPFIISGSAIPEPTSCVLLMIGMGVAMSRRKK